MTTLNAAAIQSAALAILDEEGVDKLTMRHLAARLGVEAPSLYHHVPGKDALLDRIVEALLAAVELPGVDTPASVGVHRMAGSLHGVLRAHPNAVRLLGARPSRILHLLDEAQGLRASVEAAGLSPGRATDLLRTTLVFVLGHAEASLGPPELDAAASRRWFEDGLVALRMGFGLAGPSDLEDTIDLDIEPEGQQAREAAQDVDATWTAPVEVPDAEAPSAEPLDVAGPSQEEATPEPVAAAPVAEVPMPRPAAPPPRAAAPPPRVPPPAPEPARKGLAGRLLRRAGHLLGRDD